MRVLIIVLMLFLALQVAYAETQIFSGKVITGADKEINGGVFRFTYDENSKKAFVQTPAGGVIVDNGACKPNNIFRVCINSANFSHKNITTYVYYYEIDATIYKLTGSLSASSKATLSSLLQGEPTDLEVTITNPTDFEITGIVFSYDLAPFYIIEAKGCELNGKRLIWEGSLNPKYDKTCTAKISTDKDGKYNLAGNLSYFNGYDTEKIMTNASVITVLPKQLKVSYFMDKDIKVREPFYINLSLQNLHASEEISASLKIVLPSHVSLIKDKPAFDKDERTLRRSSLLLKPSESMNYSLYLEKNSQGTEPINYKFEYAIKGISDVIENSTFVDVVILQPITKPSEPKVDEPNATPNATAVQESLQSPQAADANKTTEAAAENKTSEKVAIAEIEHKTFSEKLSSRFSKNEALVLVGVAFAVFLIIFFVNKIRKRKQPVMDEQAALKEIQEKILKKE